MKKVRLVLFALFACLLLSGCGKQKEFTVTFNAAGGSQIENQTVVEDEKAVKPEDPTKEGYVFDGWYIGDEKYDFSEKVTEDVELTAKWYAIVDDEGDKEDNKCNLTCEDGYKLVNGDSKNCQCKKIVKATEIELSVDKITLTVGETKTITAKVIPTNADDKTLTWKTSNKKVATVKNGKITAVGEGTADITVTVGDLKEIIAVTVNKKTDKPVSGETNKPVVDNTDKTVDVTSVSLSATKLSLVAGESKTVTATVNPSNATNKTVTWSSSDNSIVKVENGKITAVKAGSATVTAKAGEKTATITITVISKDKDTLSKALSSITAKNLTKGNTSISFEYSGCTISNPNNSVSDANASRTTIEAGKIIKLYRTASTGSILSTYKVTCGSESETKTVQHTIEKSTYTYTAQNNGASWVIYVNGATDYTISGGKVANIKYSSTAGGAQVGSAHDSTAGTVYRITFDNDSSTVYAVKPA